MPKKNLSPERINNTINLLQVFYGLLVQCDNKNLTYCLFKHLEFVLPFKFEQIIPWGHSTEHFSLAKNQQLQPRTHRHRLFCRCLWSPLAGLPISWWWCHDPKLTQQHLNWNTTREKTNVRMEERNTQKARWKNVNGRKQTSLSGLQAYCEMIKYKKKGWNETQYKTINYHRKLCFCRAAEKEIQFHKN